MTLTETEVGAIFDTAFEAASADEVELSMAWYHEVNREVVCGLTKVIRFSNSYIRDDTVVNPCHPLQVHVAFGNREGAAITNQLDPAGIRDAVARAEAIARVATPNESHRLTARLRRSTPTSPVSTRRPRRSPTRNATRRWPAPSSACRRTG